jgi:hypothetical protein
MGARALGQAVNQMNRKALGIRFQRALQTAELLLFTLSLAEEPGAASADQFAESLRVFADSLQGLGYGKLDRDGSGKMG